MRWAEFGALSITDLLDMDETVQAVEGARKRMQERAAAQRGDT